MGLIGIRMLFGFHGGGVFGVRTPIRRCSFSTRSLFLSPRFTCMDHRNLETLGFARDHFKIFLVQREWGPHQTCESGVSGPEGTTSKLQVMTDEHDRTRPVQGPFTSPRRINSQRYESQCPNTPPYFEISGRRYGQNIPSLERCVARDFPKSLV